MYEKFCLCLFVVILKSNSSEAKILVIPEDVPAGFAAIFGFAPPITKGISVVAKCILFWTLVKHGDIGNDHRFGFGFRLGNHADFQILYEFGPQSVTKPLQPSKVRSTTYRQRLVRRRPVFELLVRAGVIKRNSYDFNVIKDCDDETR